MSRSIKKRKFLKHCGSHSSDKEARSKANRKLRRVARVILSTGDVDTLLPNLRDVSNTWDFPSDGLAVYVGNVEEKWMRK